MSTTRELIKKAALSSALNASNTATAQANDASEQALTSAGVNPDYISWNVGVFPDSAGAVADETIGAYFTESGLWQKIKWDGTIWQPIGEPISSKSYVDDKASISKQETKDEIGIQDNGLDRNVDSNNNYLRAYRHPVIEVIAPFVDRLRLLWVEGDLMYAEHQTVIYKSLDGGVSWQLIAYRNAQRGLFNFFYVTNSGNIITNKAGGDVVMSTDDLASDSVVIPMSTNDDSRILGPQSIAKDEITGHLYIVNYNGYGSPNRIYKSTDEGTTWAVFKEFTDDDETTPSFRHWHACQYDPFDETIYFMGGDPDDEAGVYRLNSTKDDIEPVFLNQDAPQFSMPARTIGVMFFSEWIAWISDTPGSPFLYRIRRSTIGTGSVEIERIMRANSSGWWTQRAANDNSKWVASASQEGSVAIDTSTHLYAVENQGKDVYELGALPKDYNIGEGVGQFHPVGNERVSGGDEFWLNTLLISPRFTGRFRLSRSTADLRPLLSGERKYTAPVSVSGYANWETGNDPEEKTLLQTRTPPRPIADSKLYIYEAGAFTLDTGGPQGSVKIQLLVGGEVKYSFGHFSKNARATDPNLAAPVAVIDVSNKQNVEVRLIRENNASAGTGYMVYEINPPFRH